MHSFKFWLLLAKPVLHNFWAKTIRSCESFNNGTACSWKLGPFQTESWCNKFLSCANLRATVLKIRFCFRRNLEKRFTWLTVTDQLVVTKRGMVFGSNRFSLMSWTSVLDFALRMVHKVLTNGTNWETNLYAASPWESHLVRAALSNFNLLWPFASWSFTNEHFINFHITIEPASVLTSDLCFGRRWTKIRPNNGFYSSCTLCGGTKWQNLLCNLLISPVIVLVLSKPLNLICWISICLFFKTSHILLNKASTPLLPVTSTSPRNFSSLCHHQHQCNK